MAFYIAKQLNFYDFIYNLCNHFFYWFFDIDFFEVFFYVLIIIFSTFAFAIFCKTSVLYIY